MPVTIPQYSRYATVVIFILLTKKIVYSSTTVKPLNKGHIGNGSLVPCREVVLFSVGLFLNKVIKTN